MFKQIVGILALALHQTNSLSPRHDYYYYNSTYYPTYTPPRITASSSRKTYNNNDSAAGIIFSIIFFFIVGIFIYLICKRCRSNPAIRPPNHPPQNYAYPPVYNPNYYQQYPPPPNPNLYPNPQPIYPPNLAYNNPQDSWQGPDYFASRKLKQNCGFCKTFSKYGEEPRIMLSCPDRHTFHLFCINQHRAGANRLGSSAYALNACPVCNQLTSQRVRFYCMLCKEKGVEIDLKEYSDQHGVVDITQMLGRIGEYCTQCRRM